MAGLVGTRKRRRKTKRKRARAKPRKATRTSVETTRMQRICAGYENSTGR